MSRPVSLDENDAFDMRKPFLVSERLEALAYHMSLAPSPWEEYVYYPSDSVNKSTTEYVEHADRCTAKPLQGPPPDLINELLGVTIDFRQDSPLNFALKDSYRYHSFRGCLTAPHYPISDQIESYTHIVDSSLHTLIPLAVVLLLQLWIHDGAANDDTQAFHTARDILMSLGRSAVAYESANHAILGPRVDAIPIAAYHGARSAFAMMERMYKPFARDEHHRFFEYITSAFQGLNQEIVDGLPPYDVQNALSGFHLETLHLMAQAKSQSSRASSRLSLFTALHSFNMVALFQDDQLYLTGNLIRQLGEVQQRRGLQTQMQYLEVVLIFLTAAITKAYPEAVTPGRRMQFSQIFAPAASPESSPIGSTVTPQNVSIPKICRNFIFRLWPKMALVADEFSVSFGGGTFKRTDGCGYFAINKIPFDLREDRNGRRTAVSPSTGLVLKMFAKDKDFTDERDIYAQLNKYNIQHIPRNLGTFRNDWMEVNALLISYEGRPVLDGETISRSDWLHLVTVMQHLHGIGIHHHDLKFSNIVRRPDGTLVVIDFGLAALGEVCEAKDCADWVWLASVHPSAKVPEWFPPPPIYPHSRRRLSAKSLYIFSTIVVGMFFYSVLLEQPLVPSVDLGSKFWSCYVKSIAI